MDYSNNIWNQIKSLPKQGIFYLCNKETKSVYIGYSSNIPNAIIKLLNNSNKFDGYYFDTLEIVTDKKNLRIRCQYFKDLYSNMGYTLINNNRVSNRKLVIKVLEDFRSLGVGKFLFYVKIVSKGYGAITVGVFQHGSESELFVAQKYNNGVVDIIYANNDLTKEFLNVRS